MSELQCSQYKIVGTIEEVNAHIAADPTNNLLVEALIVNGELQFLVSTRFWTPEGEGLEFAEANR